MSLPSSSSEGFGDSEFRVTSLSPTADSSGHVAFDARGNPIYGHHGRFGHRETPSPRSSLQVWSNRSPTPQNFTIWEDPEDQPSPHAATPEPMSDLDEDKENLYGPPNVQATEEPEEPEDTRMDWPRAEIEMGPRDVFGTPLALLPAPAPARAPINRAINPTIPFIVRGEEERVRDDLSRHNLFRAPRRGNLFRHALRRRRGQIFFPRREDDENDDENYDADFGEDTIDDFNEELEDNYQNDNGDENQDENDDPMEVQNASEDHYRGTRHNPFEAE
ncbi:hypothetical protein N7492_010466 [Penicillium capsulatum]|uniref:Uncharacterized protein n=1 Tax=Penicillium capsulatum TaxID=69766 RepID=A0A9W9HME2_9EURO|nr:hypothetical protein N7492_010466 [Penicillium capsulatum]KAJ6112969.1 hypothetical protein N7512_008293 [Penicillium capsulatum]